MGLEDIKTVYQQRHNLPSTYAAAGSNHHTSSSGVHATTPLQGLKKVECVKNPKFQASGRKALGHLCRKYEITPTLACPFTIIHTLIDDLFPIDPKASQPKNGQNQHTVARMVRRDASTGKTGQVETEDVQNDSEYLAEVTVGTPGQRMTLNFDTGSADLWLWSTSLPGDTQNKGKANGHSIFDPSKSST